MKGCHAGLGRGWDFPDQVETGQVDTAYSITVTVTAVQRELDDAGLVSAK